MPPTKQIGKSLGLLAISAEGVPLYVSLSLIIQRGRDISVSADAMAAQVFQGLIFPGPAYPREPPSHLFFIGPEPCSAEIRDVRPLQIAK